MSEESQHDVAQPQQSDSESPLQPHAEDESKADAPNQEEQEQKPVAESASPAGESAAVAAGEARPTDPEDVDDVLTHRLDDSPENTPTDAADAAVLAASRTRTRRAFLGFAAATAGAYGVRRYLHDGPFDQMIPGALHKTYAWNANVSRALFREHALAPTYPVSKAEICASAAYLG